ncbi:MAG TPA: hypothetical protein VFL07_00850, partial [Rudaea sp.]|nr:hypothetical protein [Rudaea sp.]
QLVMIGTGGRQRTVDGQPAVRRVPRCDARFELLQARRNTGRAQGIDLDERSQVVSAKFNEGRQSHGM